MSKIILSILVLISTSLFAIDMTGTPVDWSRLDLTDLGPVEIDYDYTGIRDIPAVPAVGVHPRIFFGPEDLDGIRYRLANTICGREVMAQIYAFGYLQYVGNAGYDRSADYSIAPSGVTRIGNVGLYDSSVYFNKLRVGDMTGLDGTDSTRKGILISCMAVMAFEALVNDDVQQAEDIATAITTWVQIISPTFTFR